MRLLTVTKLGRNFLFLLARRCVDINNVTLTLWACKVLPTDQLTCVTMVVPLKPANKATYSNHSKWYKVHAIVLSTKDVHVMI